jgi:hypothetical protein
MIGFKALILKLCDFSLQEMGSMLLLTLTPEYMAAGHGMRPFNTVLPVIGDLVNNICNATSEITSFNNFTELKNALPNNDSSNLGKHKVTDCDSNGDGSDGSDSDYQDAEDNLV